jgi:hypothetical protein
MKFEPGEQWCGAPRLRNLHVEEIDDVLRGSSSPVCGAAAGCGALGAAARLPLSAREYRRPPVGVELVLEVDDLDVRSGPVDAPGWPVTEEITERPWGLRLRLLDPDGYPKIESPDTPERSLLGLALGLAGEHQQARQLLTDTLARSRQVLGSDHPDPLRSASWLADEMWALGDYEGARTPPSPVAAESSATGTPTPSPWPTNSPKACAP